MKTMLLIAVIVLVAGASVVGTLLFTGWSASAPTAADRSAPEEVNWLAMMFKERAVIRRALQEPALRDTSWFRTNYAEDMRGLEKRLLEDVRVRVVPGTRLVEVSFETTEAADAAPVVNSVVKVTLEWVRELIRQNTRSNLQTLMDEEARLKRTLAMRRDELSQLSQAVPGLHVGSGLPPDERPVLNELNVALARAELKCMQASYAYQRRATALLDGREKLADDVEARIAADRVCAAAVADLQKLRAKLEAMISRVPDSTKGGDEPWQRVFETASPGDLPALPDALKEDSEAGRLFEQAALLKQTISDRRLAIARPEIQAVLKPTYQAARAAREEMYALSEQMTTAQAKQKDIDRKVADFRAAEAEYQEVLKLYQDVSARRRRLEIVLNASDSTTVDRMGDAMEPLEPVGMNRWRASARVLITGMKPADPMAE